MSGASVDITKNESIPVSQEDYLDEDKPLRGQNYVCLSFISPEDVMIDKNVYFFNKFTESFSKDVLNLLSGLREKYPNDTEIFDLLKENNSHFFDAKQLQEQYEFYKGIHSSDLETEYHKAQNYRPTMRGIKVRGTFETLKEAQTRAEVLKRMGDKFDIYVAQVGCWCPWSPNPNDLDNQEYSETGLNTLMKKYKENIENKDIEYSNRKEDKISKINEENIRRKAENDAQAKLESVSEAAESAESTTESPTETPTETANTEAAPADTTSVSTAEQ